MRRVRAAILAAVCLMVILSGSAVGRAPGALLYEQGRALLERGDAARALDLLARVRWHAEDGDLRRLAAVGLSRCESALPDSFGWTWAVLPADNLGSPAGLEGLPFALSWLLRDDLQAAGCRRVAPLERVIRPLDLTRLSAFASSAPPQETARLPIQTIEGLKARLSLIPGPTGKPLFVGPINGQSDPALRDAIRGLQTMSGIDPTGEADAVTMGALADLYERRLLEPLPAVDPASLGSLASAIPSRTLLRPTMRVRDGRLVFGLVALDAEGRSQWEPIETAGPLEKAPEIVRSAVDALLAVAGSADGAPVPSGGGVSARRIDAPSSLAELQEAGAWALLRARGESSLARTRGTALRDRNPGWDRLAAAVDADQAGVAVIARWEEACRREILLLGAGGEESLIDRLDRLASDLPAIGSKPGAARRGPLRALGEEGRLHIEGHFP